MATRQTAASRADRKPRPYATDKRLKRRSALSSSSSPPSASSTSATPSSAAFSSSSSSSSFFSSSSSSSASSASSAYSASSSTPLPHLFSCDELSCPHPELPSEEDMITMPLSVLETHLTRCTASYVDGWKKHQAWGVADFDVQGGEKIKRPPNCYVLYISHQSYVRQWWGVPLRPDYSDQVTALWRKEPPSVITYFTRLDALLKNIHQCGFPEYEFEPERERSKVDAIGGSGLANKSTTLESANHPTNGIADVTSEASNSTSSAHEQRLCKGYHIPASHDGAYSVGTMDFRHSGSTSTALQMAPPAPSTSIAPEPATDYGYLSDAGRSHEGLSSGSTATDVTLYTPEILGLHDPAASMSGFAGFPNSLHEFNPSQSNAYLLQQRTLAPNAHLNAQKRWPSPALFRREAALGHYSLQPDILPSIPPLPEFRQGYTYPQMYGHQQPNSPSIPPGSLATPAAMSADLSSRDSGPYMGPFPDGGTDNGFAWSYNGLTFQPVPAPPFGAPVSSASRASSLNQSVDAHRARLDIDNANYGPPYLGTQSVAGWCLPTSKAQTEFMFNPENVGSHSPSPTFLPQAIQSQAYQGNMAVHGYQGSTPSFYDAGNTGVYGWMPTPGVSHQSGVHTVDDGHELSVGNWF